MKYWIHILRYGFMFFSAKSIFETGTWVNIANDAPESQEHGCWQGRRGHRALWVPQKPPNTQSLFKYVPSAEPRTQETKLVKCVFEEFSLQQLVPPIRKQVTTRIKPKSQLLAQVETLES